MHTHPKIRYNIVSGCRYVNTCIQNVVIGGWPISDQKLKKSSHTHLSRAIPALGPFHFLMLDK